ncbi:hypothetical protein [Streptomyces griseoloalbus]|uniref:Uncharacterized protein n=1 Tax=Streptomyces griseoloalbus TaxID=67303 RepID=A0A7W8BRY4_9ACTN|nr:hypothetical protein [Streptomyces albaduncus]MBB5128482.1 hypothetical protein [Streptomyces albaduncus]GGW68227.1 hypothetical protein GCM10010340_52940 [Streptomyces albaduncus]
MNDSQRTRILRAAQAINGARDARKRIASRAEFVRIVAAQLQEIAPSATRVLILPTTHHGRPTYAVVLYSATTALATTREQRSAVHGLLQRAFPAADWTRPRLYDATTGGLTVHEPTAPAALDLDTAPEARP